jgi:hypothetical protein
VVPARSGMSNPRVKEMTGGKDFYQVGPVSHRL